MTNFLRATRRDAGRSRKNSNSRCSPTLVAIHASPSRTKLPLRTRRPTAPKVVPRSTRKTRRRGSPAMYVRVNRTTMNPTNAISEAKDTLNASS